MTTDLEIPAPEVTGNQHQIVINHGNTTYHGDAYITTNEGPRRRRPDEQQVSPSTRLTLTVISPTSYLRIQAPPEFDDLLAIQEVLDTAIERVLVMTRKDPVDPDPKTGADWKDQDPELVRAWRQHVENSNKRGFESIARKLGRRWWRVRDRLIELKEFVPGVPRGSGGAPPADSPTTGPPSDPSAGPAGDLLDESVVSTSDHSEAAPSATSDEEPPGQEGRRWSFR